MRVALLTREYPPEVYGGAGVHVDFLSRHLRGLVDLSVLCTGTPGRRPAPDAVDGAGPAGAVTAGRAAMTVTGYADTDPALAGANPALRVFSTDLALAAATAELGVDLVHSHTWYANLGGHLAGLLCDVPHVVTAHSLEPLRPWKVEQLGGGYRLSSWAERTAFEAAGAVIAVSEGMRRDVLAAYPALDPVRVHVVRNGIDTDLYAPLVAGTPTGERALRVRADLGIDPARPYVVFIGRITRQKGVPHLLRAALRFDPAAQVVVLAGAPDTPELAAETDAAVAVLRGSRTGVVIEPSMLPRTDLVAVLAGAAAFVCPSVYEPLGIVNLEAMACEVPVVASDVGGIPEVVDDGVTGALVHYDARDPAGFERGLADAVNAFLADPARAAAMGAAGRARAVSEFGWARIAEQTLEVYRSAAARA